MYDRYIGIEISKVNNMMRRKCIREELFFESDDDVTNKNGWIIGFIAKNNDKDIFQKDIENKFSIRRSTVSGILSLMEKKGYIRRESVDYDARLKKLTLTEKSWDYYNKIHKKINEGEEMLRSGLEEDEISTFLNILDKIKKNLEEQEAKSNDKDSGKMYTGI